ncbi:hypothetical protein BUV99_13550, partial [Corynebacterium diphtheriae]
MAEFNGNTKRLDLNVRTDIEGENIPDGQYTAVMYTDLVNQLNITDLNGQLMKGSVSLAGTVGWADQVDWDLTGVAEFNGNTKRLDLNVRTDIEGENIPDGQYTAV